MCSCRCSVPYLAPICLKENMENIANVSLLARGDYSDVRTLPQAILLSVAALLIERQATSVINERLTRCMPCRWSRYEQTVSRNQFLAPVLPFPHETRFLAHYSYPHSRALQPKIGSGGNSKAQQNRNCILRDRQFTDTPGVPSVPSASGDRSSTSHCPEAAPTSVVRCSSTLCAWRLRKVSCLL